MTVSDFCSKNLVTILADATLQEAAQKMDRHGVGCLVALGPGGRSDLRGLLTDRDLALKGFLEGFGPAESVSKIMSCEVVAVSEQDSVSLALKRMADHQVRRLVVLGTDGTLIGLLSADDLIRSLGKSLGALAELYALQLGTERRRQSHDFTRMA